MFDIIGDVHGHADELVQLLHLLGYSSQNGIYAHSKRQAIFVGDFIDRGPKIREVLTLVRSMVEAGTARAVMGNHEFNAIAYHTPDPADSERFLREHSEKNTRQHQQTIDQIPPAELPEWISWFRTLPMSIDLAGLRIVHACWDPQGLAVIREQVAEHGGISNGFMAEAVSHGTRLFRAVENVLKGPELELPSGSYRDKEGNERRHIRTRWFESPSGRSYAAYALPQRPEAPSTPVPDSLSLPVPVYESTKPPVFFGHYWLSNPNSRPLASNVGCVDYSVARGGHLCAYRWSGESDLCSANFVAIPSEPACQIPPRF